LVFPSLSAREKEEAEAMRKNPFYGAPVLAVSSSSFFSFFLFIYFTVLENYLKK
jgi:hypothetical protein